jgi:hypothetical protein
MTLHDIVEGKEPFKYQRQRYYIKDECDNTLGVINIVCRDDEHSRSSKMKKFLECKYPVKALINGQVFANFQLTCYDLPVIVMERLNRRAKKCRNPILSEFENPYNVDSSLFD